MPTSAGCSMHCPTTPTRRAICWMQGSSRSRKFCSAAFLRKRRARVTSGGRPRQARWQSLPEQRSLNWSRWWMFSDYGVQLVVPAWPASIDGQTTLDITHEALIRQWDRLRGWAEDEAQSADRTASWSRMRSSGNRVVWRYGARLTSRRRSIGGGGPGRARFGRSDMAGIFRWPWISWTRVPRRARRKNPRSGCGACGRYVIYAASAPRGWRPHLIMAGALGGTYWFGFAEHIAYYRSYAERWGEPIGIGALDAEQVRHRQYSLKFVQRGVSLRTRFRTGFSLIL